MTKFLRLVFATCIAFTLHFSASSQSLSINTDGSSADASAMLDVKSTVKGILVPRMNKTERNAIAAPATGLMVFQNAPDSVGFYYYNGTSWLWLATANNNVGWLTTGNAGIDPVNNFLGTTDANSLRLRYNNIFSGQINDSTTYLGYKAGLTNPALAHNIGIGPSALQNNNTTYNIAIGDSALYGNTAGGVIGIGYRALMMNNAFDNIAIGYNALDSNTTGNRNVAIGNHALRKNKTGNVSVAIGYGALANSVGVFNTAVGDATLFNNTTGYSNTAIGSNVMDFNTTGYANTAMGVNSMYNNVAGFSNTAIGYQSLFQNDSTSGNTAVGLYSMYSHKKNANNTSIGLESMQFDSAGSLNTAAGWRALRNNKTGVENVAMGVGALEQNTGGSYNIAAGRSAGFFNDTADYTTSIGHSALAYSNRSYTTALGAFAGNFNSYSSTNITQGAENTMLGYSALTGNAFGSQNVAIGFKAAAIFEPNTFYSGTSPSRNVAIGDSAYNQGRGNDVVAIGYRALSKSTTNHHQSVAVGSRALLNAIASYPNTAVGYSSQDSATTAGANTSMGSYSLMSNKIGGNNTAIGNAAMMEAYNPAGLPYPYDNTAVGNDALRFTRYYGHVAIGAGALRNDTSGVYNTAIGNVSMYNNLSGSLNVAVGVSTLRSNTTGWGNTALGTNTMYNHKTGDNNSAIGYESMLNDTAGAYNTAMGWRSLKNVQRGWENTALGVGAIEYSDSSYYNTALGRGAMIAKGGRFNTVVGFFASGDYIGLPTTNYYMNEATIVGAYAGYRNTGNQNTFVGSNSGFGVTDTLTGIENTGLGAYTLTYNTSGKSNTAVGMGALYGNQTGNGSVAVGTRALGNGGAFNYNIAIGDSAMYGNNANENVAIGTFAMRFNNTGTQNTTLGNYALQNTNTGNYNVAIGHQALLSSNANGNTAMGFTAGSTNTTGTFNTLLGYNADVSATNLTNAAAIGSNALIAQSNSLILGSINGINGATADTRVGIGTTTPDSTFSVADKFLVGNSGTVQYDNTVPVMNYMFKSGTTNADRMVIAHSPGASTWGLQYQDATDQFNFLGAAASRLTIELGSGQIGIGTAAPSTKLHIYESTNANVNLRVASVSSGFEPGIELLKTGAGSDWRIKTATTGNLVFTRSVDDLVTPIDEYEMSSTALRPFTDGSNTLGTATNRWSTVYSTVGAINTSDARDKENISDLNYGLNEIMKLRPVSFTWKENPQWGKKIGFIAQEVKPVLSEVVQVGTLKTKAEAKNDQGNALNKNSDKLGIYYSDIIPVTVKAIQEQQLLINKQQKTIDSQQKAIAELMERIKKLENK